MNNPFYFPIDCAWPSPESDIVRDKAIAEYNKQIEAGRDYVALIASSHWASQGYWIEFKKKEIKYPDVLVEEYKKP